ncbi:MAG: DUF2794 domain-containing protein [Pseudomonadota bacterium]
MSDSEPIALFGAEAERLSSRKSEWQSFKDTQTQGSRARTDSQVPKRTTFNRQELYSILNVYGRQVAVGEWRDYAITHTRDTAIFSIFRRSSEMPLYTVEKCPDLAKKQGAYSVVAAGGMILKRGHDLKQVLKSIDRRPKLVAV